MLAKKITTGALLLFTILSIVFWWEFYERICDPSSQDSFEIGATGLLLLFCIEVLVLCSVSVALNRPLSSIFLIAFVGLFVACAYFFFKPYPPGFSRIRVGNFIGGLLSIGFVILNALMLVRLFRTTEASIVNGKAIRNSGA